jgi:hypothetical protein
MRAEFDHAGVQRHAHPNRLRRGQADDRPRLRGQGALGGERGRHGVGGAGKGGTASVPNCLEHHASVAVNRIAQNGIVAREGLGHRARVLLPQGRAPGDVGEEERNRAIW